MSRDYLTEFKNFLRIEKGLASNTVTAYSHDLETLFEFCRKQELGYHSAWAGKIFSAGAGIC